MDGIWNYYSRYINTFLNCDIGSRAIYNLPRLYHRIILLVNILVTCSRVLVTIIWNVFTTVRYINIYLYNITWAYQSCILPFITRVSIHIKCAYGNIQAYPPHVYHLVHLSHYRENVRTVTYRPINPVCIIYYVCLSNGKFSVVIQTWYMLISHKLEFSCWHDQYCGIVYKHNIYRDCQKMFNL